MDNKTPSCQDFILPKSIPKFYAIPFRIPEVILWVWKSWLKTFFFLFFLGLYLWHMEVPGSGFESELQLPAHTQPQEHRIWTASATYATAWSNAGSLATEQGHGLNPHLQRLYVTELCQLLDLPSHSRNSFFFFFLIFLENFLCGDKWLQRDQKILQEDKIGSPT